MNKHKNKILSAFLFSFSLFFFTLSAYCGGDTSLDILRADISPKAMAMGGAYCSAGDDLLCAYYNPAVIAQLPNPEAAFSYSGGFEKTQINYLAFATPLPYTGFSKVSRGVIGISAETTSLGQFDYRYIMPSGDIVSKKMDAEKNMIFSLSYAEKAGEGNTSFESINLYLQHFMGLSAKYVKSVLLEDYSAGTFAFDAGYKMLEPKKGFMFGLSLSNIGGKIKYIDESYPLSQTFRASLGLRTNPIKEHQILFSAEYDKFLKSEDSAIKIGVEYHLEKILNFRAGYRALEENKGLTLGLGFFLDNVSVDFATSMLDVYSYSAFSLSYRFSTVEVKEIKKEKKIKIEKEEPKPKETPKKQPEKKKVDDFLMII